MAGYLQASGNPISMSQINSVFDGRGNNLNAYRGTTWFTAAGGSGTFSSGTISFSDFYLKGPNSPGFATVSLATLPSQSFAYYTGDFLIDVTLILYANGTWVVNDDTGEMFSGNWGSPTTAGAGSSYWVKFTRTSYTPIGGPEYSTATTAWLNLGVAQSINVYTYFDNINSSSGTYTIEIATDSGGANIIATRTGVQLFAVPGTPP
jgi:hypothetical protein